MVNASLNWASIVGIVLAIGGALLYFMRSFKPALARDYDVFFAAIGLLCGGILFFQGWRLDPIIQFGQFLLAGTTVFFAYESVRLRGVATEQARRSAYFDDEPATRETIDSDGWLHTGDIAEMDARGYLKITDRIKDMFIMGGFNCYPAEIESALFQMDGIAAAAVIGVPDERMGEVGMAFVVLEEGASLDEKSIIAWAREHMANYRVPRSVRVLDELPMNASGKVTKFVLRELAQATGDGG